MSKIVLLGNNKDFAGQLHFMLPHVPLLISVVHNPWALPTTWQHASSYQCFPKVSSLFFTEPRFSLGTDFPRTVPSIQDVVCALPISPAGPFGTVRQSILRSFWWWLSLHWPYSCVVPPVCDVWILHMDFVTLSFWRQLGTALYSSSSRTLVSHSSRTPARFYFVYHLLCKLIHGIHSLWRWLFLLCTGPSWQLTPYMQPRFAITLLELPSSYCGWSAAAHSL